MEDCLEVNARLLRVSQGGSFACFSRTQEGAADSGDEYDVTYLADILISIPDLESNQVQFAILQNGTQCALTVLIEENLNSQAYGHNLMREDLNLITIRAG